MEKKDKYVYGNCEKSKNSNQVEKYWNVVKNFEILVEKSKYGEKKVEK